MLNSAYNTFSHKNSRGSSQLVYILLPTRRQCSVSLLSSCFRQLLGQPSVIPAPPPGTHRLCNLPPLWAGTGLGNSLLMNSIERSNRMSLPRWGYKRSQLCSGPSLSHSGGDRLPHSEQPCGAHGLWDRCLQPVWTWGLPTAMRVSLKTNLTLRWLQPWPGSWL